MPDYAKDAMVAILGAAVALAGLLLIFSGFLFAQAESFPKATTDDDIIDKYRNAGRFAVIPFLLSLAVAALTVAWMICPVAHVYWATIIGMCGLLLVSAAYGGFILIKYL